MPCINIMWLAYQPADKSSRLFGDVLPWLLVLIGVVLIGSIAIYFIRRWLRGGGPSAPQGFTLEDLRQLHAGGELTDEEFERAKATMIGRLKSSPSSSSAIKPRGDSMS